MDFLLGLDYGILDFTAENIRNVFLDPVMAVLSLFAENGIGIILLGLILLIPRKTRYAAAIALAAAGIVLLVGEFGIKLLVQRPRPFITYESFHSYAMPFTLNMGKARGYSFPSMHTACSFSFAVSMFVFNKKAGVLSVVIAFLIGFSRLYNYVHFPSDVLAGAVFGIIVALLVIYLFKKYNIEEKITRIGKKNRRSL